MSSLQTPIEVRTYPGVYRGMVEEVNDVEVRARYRVRVGHVHPADVPREHLPWSEVAVFGGRGFGDIPNYEAGDRVWVMFEGGDRAFPVIVGGWISRAEGIDEMLPEQTHQYPENRKRWIRTDRAGNIVEMSEKPGELHVKLRSGKAELIVTQADDSIRVTARGAVEISAERVVVTSSQTFLTSDDVIVSAKGRDKEGKPDGHVNIYANADARVYAADTVSIGQYLDIEGKPRQGEKTNVQSERVHVGKHSPEDGTKRTLQVNVEGFNEVKVSSKHHVAVDAPVVDVTAKDVTIDAERRVLVKAEQFKVDAERILLKSPHVDLGDEGGNRVGRVGDRTRKHRIRTGSSQVRATG